jgi:uncharacterized protein YbjT (DUF2867 family)
VKGKAMRVAVVGPTGVLGRALIPLLLEHDYTVRAVVRSPSKAHEVLPQGIEIAEGDLLAPLIEKQLPTLLEGCDAVLHMATAIFRAI